MSNRRAWYLSDVGDMTEFPVTERFGSGMTREATAIELQAERGRRFVDGQFECRVWKLNFRFFTQAEYDFFEALHLAVNGSETPFYFVLDPNASPIDAVLVRKERGYAPIPLEIPRPGGQRTWDYPMILTEEVDSALEISD